MNTFRVANGKLEIFLIIKILATMNYMYIFVLTIEMLSKISPAPPPPFIFSSVEKRPRS